MVKVNVTEEEKEGLKNTFKNFGKKKTEEEMFYDLCFCICAPQTTFKSNHMVISALQYLGFYKNNIPVRGMHKVVKPTRFYKNKTKYLLEAKKEWPTIYNMLIHKGTINSRGKREWLVRHIKGLGMKAASHLLRNCGDDQLAIIDTHIIKFLGCTIPTNNSAYLTYEKIFCIIAKKNNMSPAELDALIWQRYSKTPWKEFTY